MDLFSKQLFYVAIAQSDIWSVWSNHTLINSLNWNEAWPLNYSNTRVIGWIQTLTQSRSISRWWGSTDPFVGVFSFLVSQYRRFKPTSTWTMDLERHMTSRLDVLFLPQTGKTWSRVDQRQWTWFRPTDFSPESELLFNPYSSSLTLHLSLRVKRYGKIVSSNSRVTTASWRHQWSPVIYVSV